MSNHSGRALLLGLLGDGWAPFFVTNSLMQDQPDQPTVSMGNGSDSLFVPQTRYRTTINKLENSSFSLDCGFGRLVENAPHVAVALRRPVAVIHACAFIVAGAGTHPRGEAFVGGKGRCSGTDFGNDLLR